MNYFSHLLHKFSGKSGKLTDNILPPLPPELDYPDLAFYKIDRERLEKIVCARNQANARVGRIEEGVLEHLDSSLPPDLTLNEYCNECLSSAGGSTSSALATHLNEGMFETINEILQKEPSLELFASDFLSDKPNRYRLSFRERNIGVVRESQGFYKEVIEKDGKFLGFCFPLQTIDLYTHNRDYKIIALIGMKSRF